MKGILTVSFQYPCHYTYTMRHSAFGCRQQQIRSRQIKARRRCIFSNYITIARCELESHYYTAVLGLYSLSGKTSYRKILWSLEAARFGFKLFQSLWNLAGTSATLLPRCLSNFRAIRPLQHPISRLRDFTRFGSKTSYRLVNRGPEKHLL